MGMAVEKRVDGGPAGNDLAEQRAQRHGSARPGQWKVADRVMVEVKYPRPAGPDLLPLEDRAQPLKLLWVEFATVVHRVAPPKNLPHGIQADEGDGIGSALARQKVEFGIVGFVAEKHPFEAAHVGRFRPSPHPVRARAVVVVAGHRQHLEPGRPQSGQEIAGLAVIFLARVMHQVAGDHDHVVFGPALGGGAQARRQAA